MGRRLVLEAKQPTIVNDPAGSVTAGEVMDDASERLWLLEMCGVACSRNCGEARVLSDALREPLPGNDELRVVDGKDQQSQPDVAG